MELGVLERLVLLKVLPEKGDVLTIRIVHELRQRLSFSEKEIKELEFKEDEGNKRMTWNASRPRNIEIGPKARDIIRKALDDMSNKGELTEEYLSICELFEVGKEG